VLADLGDEIATRGLVVRREGWERAPALVADEGHLTYALHNLLESLVHEVPAQHELVVRVGDNGTIGLRFAGAGGVAAKLQGFLRSECGRLPPAALPLRFTLARAVIARSGGRVAVEAGEGDETRVTVALSGPGGAVVDGTRAVAGR
jgi:hypothetical protein